MEAPAGTGLESRNVTMGLKWRMPRRDFKRLIAIRRASQDRAVDNCSSTAFPDFNISRIVPATTRPYIALFYVIVGIFVAAWIISFAIYRARGYDGDRGVGALEPLLAAIASKNRRGSP